MVINRHGVKRSSPTSYRIPSAKPTIPEYNRMFAYCKGDLVWYGELQYIAKDYVAGETPDNSDNWAVYVKTK